MFSLHNIEDRFLEHCFLYNVFNQIFFSFITFVFFILIFIVNLFNLFFNLKYQNILSKIVKLFVINIYIYLIFIIIFFINVHNYLYNFIVNDSYFYISFGNKLENISLMGDVLILLCLITSLITWFFLSERYLTTYNNSFLYFSIFFVFTVNMVYTNNILTMFIFFELIFLPSLFFVYLLGYSKKVEKTIKYLLLWTLCGSIIVLVSIVYLYSITNSLNFNYIKYIKLSNFQINFLYLGIFIGFGIKIPLWPFHYWLTKVHVEAPTGFSIFLSGFLVKTALFCFIILFNLLKTKNLILLSLVIVTWGAIDSSIRMWTSTDIKRLIAFATIQEMNLIMLFVFLNNYTNYKILNSFILIHGLLSALFFFLVDQIQKRYQTRNLNNIGGLMSKALILSFIIWVALLIFRGFPIFSKFIIEWELLMLLYENFNILGLLIFFFISFFGVIGFFRVWFIVLYGQPTKNLVNCIDILKVDKIISFFLIFLLSIIGLLIYLFKVVFNIKKK